MSDIDYVYAGKGWEPKGGEHCEAVSGSGFWDGWAKCEILPESEWPKISADADYPIHIPGVPSNGGSKNWAVRSQDLRKRRPPEQKDSNQIAEPHFIEDLNNWLNKEKVES